MVKVEIPEVNCLRCFWKWEPRVSRPRRCPRCQSYDWDKEPQKNKAEVQE